MILVPLKFYLFFTILQLETQAFMHAPSISLKIEPYFVRKISKSAVILYTRDLPKDEFTDIGCLL